MTKPGPYGPYRWTEQRWHPLGCQCWRCKDQRLQEFEARVKQSMRDAFDAAVKTRPAPHRGEME